MSLYVTGTVNMTNNSAAVVGVGTAFVANVNTGATPDGFFIPGETVYYTVLSVTDGTHLTLSVPYAGATGNGKSYQIARDWTANLGLAEIQPGDPNWVYLLVQKVIRKLDTWVGTAAGIPNTPAGNIAATNVQAAINELDTEKQGSLTNSAGLAAALNDETGTGLAVFNTSPAFATQISTPKIVTASGDLEITPTGNNDVVLQGSGTGKVGIGTTAPVLALHVSSGLLGAPASSGSTQTYGTARLRGNDNEVMDFGFLAGGAGAWVQSTDQGNLATNYPLLLQLNGGNVGIGTTAPGMKLHIDSGTSGAPVTSGTTQTYGALRIEGNDNGVLDIGAYGTGKYWIQVTDKLNLSTEYDLLLQLNGGNVGIGTTAPGMKLHIDSGTSGAPVTSGTTQTYGALRIEGNDNGVLDIGAYGTGKYWIQVTDKLNLSTEYDLLLQLNGGNVGIGMAPAVQFELSGSVGQKASGTTWSNPSDARLKDILGPADLQRCYDDIKELAQYLIRYRLKDDCFKAEQATDRTLTGFAAGDVQKVIPKAVNIVPFTKVAVIEGEEEYQEQDYVMETIEIQEIEVVAGVPILKVKTKEQKRLLVDEVQVKDELGNPVTFDDKGEIKPLMHSIPRMVTKSRPKERKDIIEDCLNLDMSQVYMQMFGAVMKVIEKLEVMESKNV